MHDQQRVVTVIYPIAAGFFALRLVFAVASFFFPGGGNLAVTLQVVAFVIGVIVGYLTWRKIAYDERRAAQQLAGEQKQIDLPKAELLPGESLKAER